MSDLAAKINEMIDILQEIDPAEAAKFRGGAKEQRAVRTEPSKPIEVVRSLPPVREAKIRNSKRTLKAGDVRGLRSSEPLAGILGLRQNPARLIEGIIFSEIISRPVSQRHGRRRF